MESQEVVRALQEARKRLESRWKIIGMDDDERQQAMNKQYSRILQIINEIVIEENERIDSTRREIDIMRNDINQLHDQFPALKLIEFIMPSEVCY